MSSPQRSLRSNRPWHRPVPVVDRRHEYLPLTADGVPAATADGPRPSPVVWVSAESRGGFPWLPARVIAGSVWHGPQHARVQVDERGRAVRWRSRPPTAR